MPCGRSLLALAPLIALPTTVEWELPAGARGDPAGWPYPQRFVHAPLALGIDTAPPARAR